MAVVTRPTPDEFNNPVARTAPDKGRIVNILNLTRRLGESVVSLLTGLLAAALILYSGYVLAPRPSAAAVRSPRSTPITAPG